MTNILTITLNPALDLATAVPQVRPGQKLRCDPPAVDPGGGGINVSRVIKRLGGDSLVFAALGGATGDRLAHLAAREGLRLHRFPAPGETRESLTVTDRANGRRYRFVLPGPNWRRSDVAAVVTDIAAAGHACRYIVLSGSLPPGVPADFPARLATRMRGQNPRLILDTSGDGLVRATTAKRPLHVLRMDDTEAEDLAGQRLTSRADSADFAQSLAVSGASEIVIVARGADGNVLATAGKRLFAKAASVPVKSKVGAGDSFVAAFTLALARDRPLAQALAEGTAAASAAVMTEATELCRRVDVRRLVGDCPVTSV
jgi:6-phosphofructokinase 2